MSLQDKRQGSPKRHRPHVAHRRTSLGGGPEGAKMMQNLENEGEEELERGDKQQISPSSSSEGVHKEMNTNSAPSKTKPKKRNLGLFGKKKEVNYVQVRNTGGDNDVPLILTDCIAEVKKRGENVEGIFRVSGLKDEVAQILKSYEKGKPVPLGEKDIHAVSGTLKQYLRGMKVPIMTYELYDSFIETFKLPEDEQLKGIKVAVQNLPPGNRFCVALIMELLYSFLPNEPVTKMGPENFSIVFTPSIMWSRGTAGTAAELTNTVNSTKLVSRMISDYKYIFTGKTDSSDVPQDENFQATLRRGQVELAMNLLGELKNKKAPPPVPPRGGSLSPRNPRSASPGPPSPRQPPRSASPGPPSPRNPLSASPGPSSPSRVSPGFQNSPRKAGAKKKVNLQNLFEHSSNNSPRSPTPPPFVSSSPPPSPISPLHSSLPTPISELPPPITGTEEELASLPSPLSLPPPPPSIVVGRDEEEDRSEGSLGELGDLKGLEAWTQGGDFSPSSAVQSFSMGKITEMDFRKTIGKMSSAEVANITKMLYECLEDEEPEE